MAKKKLVLKKVKPPKKAPKPAAKKAARPAKPLAKKPVKPVGKSAAKSPPPAPAKASSKPAAAQASASDGSLGRPLVTQEEKLYMLFHDDYEARQVFEFLQVDTVADLVELAHDDIIRVLTAPVRRTVQRIRQRLAEKNRSLAGDEEFTRQHKARLS